MRALDHNIVDVPGYEGCGRCTVCGGFEGELLTWCPGYKLNHDTLLECYDGNVTDLACWIRSNRRRAQ